MLTENRFENKALEIMMGIDIELEMETDDYMIDYLCDLAGDKGVDLEEIKNRIECAGNKVRVKDTGDSIELEITPDNKLGIVLH